MIRNKIEDLMYLFDVKEPVVLTDEILDLLIQEFEELKKEMEGCTGEDCLYPIERRLNQLKN